jgi:hypothetical protein
MVIYVITTTWPVVVRVLDVLLGGNYTALLPWLVTFVGIYYGYSLKHHGTAQTGLRRC